MSNKTKELLYKYFVTHRLRTMYMIAIVLFFALIIKLTFFKDEINSNKTEIKSVEYDLPEILRDGKLTVLAENSSTSFFIYRGRKMGFEYEILKEFAHEIGVELDIKIIDNLDDVNQLLLDGEGDLLACNYTDTKDREEIIDFSYPIMRTKQVLIQRKPYNWQSLTPEQYKLKTLHDPSQLTEKEVYVWKKSSYHDRLINLGDEIGDSIHIKNQNGMIGSEELIEMVSEGIIDYTVADENVAKINSSFYDNIDFSLPLSFKQKIAFGIRKTSPLLKTRIDKWLESFTKKATYKYIYHKYFELASVTANTESQLPKSNGKSISIYDNFFKAAAKKYGWDWRMLASLAYQESKFNPDAISFGGAYGMMQFMPYVGSKYGVYPTSPPQVQIEGGMKKLKEDYIFWSTIPDKVQREKFTLASYNAGRSHIQDAQRLAEKYGKDPLVWDSNVEEMVLNLSKSEYYKDKFVESGAMKGTITVRYVREIYSRYLGWIALYK